MQHVSFRHIQGCPITQSTHIFGQNPQFNNVRGGHPIEPISQESLFNSSLIELLSQQQALQKYTTDIMS